ncbi:hypothetical protein HYU21_04505 [Candidatus Woesearchaeota archaeon]|nr:hypothetical protein [Candidatus Woesearchaeota archaeon]
MLKQKETSTKQKTDPHKIWFIVLILVVAFALFFFLSGGLKKGVVGQSIAGLNEDCSADSCVAGLVCVSNVCLLDTDGDRTADVTDIDDDNDGICDPDQTDSSCTGNDNCPLDSNPYITDSDDDGYLDTQAIIDCQTQQPDTSPYLIFITEATDAVTAYKAESNRDSFLNSLKTAINNLFPQQNPQTDEEPR